MLRNICKVDRYFKYVFWRNTYKMIYTAKRSYANKFPCSESKCLRLSLTLRLVRIITTDKIEQYSILPSESELQMVYVDKEAFQ